MSVVESWGDWHFHCEPGFPLGGCEAVVTASGGKGLFGGAVLAKAD